MKAPTIVVMICCLLSGTWLHAEPPSIPATRMIDGFSEFSRPTWKPRLAAKEHHAIATRILRHRGIDAAMAAKIIARMNPAQLDRFAKTSGSPEPGGGLGHGLQYVAYICLAMLIIAIIAAAAA